MSGQCQKRQSSHSASLTGDDDQLYQMLRLSREIQVMKVYPGQRSGKCCLMYAAGPFQ